MKLKTSTLYLVISLSLLPLSHAQLELVAAENIPPYKGENYEDFITKEFFERYPEAKKVVDLPTFRAVNSNYGIDKNNAYYGKNILAGVDKDTLRVHYTSSSRGEGYMLDKNSVIYEGKIIPGTDPETFDFLGSSVGFSFHYALDKNHVFINNEVIDGALPESFVFYTNGHARDAKHIYYRDQQLKNSDADSFRLFKSIQPNMATNIFGFAVDKNQAYYYPDVIEGADVQTFKPITEKIAKDSHNVYLESRKLDSVVDTESFDFFSQGESGPEFFKDNKHIYYLEFSKFRTISDANPATFYIKPISYARVYGLDNQFVYAFSSDGYKILEGLAPAKTEFYGPFITDGKILYNKLSSYYTAGKSDKGFAKNRIPSYGFELVENDIDLSSFEYLGGDFAMTKEHVLQGSGRALKILGKRSELNPKLIEATETNDAYFIIGDKCYDHYSNETDCAELK